MQYFHGELILPKKQHAVKICKQIEISKIRSCESGIKVNSVFTEELQVLIK